MLSVSAPRFAGSFTEIPIVSRETPGSLTTSQFVQWLDEVGKKDSLPTHAAFVYEDRGHLYGAIKARAKYDDYGRETGLPSEDDALVVEFLRGRGVDYQFQPGSWLVLPVLKDKPYWMLSGFSVEGKPPMTHEEFVWATNYAIDHPHFNTVMGRISHHRRHRVASKINNRLRQLDKMV